MKRKFIHIKDSSILVSSVGMERCITMAQKINLRVMLAITCKVIIMDKEKFRCETEITMIHTLNLISRMVMENAKKEMKFLSGNSKIM
jgi:hypothetical protein